MVSLTTALFKLAVALNMRQASGANALRTRKDMCTVCCHCFKPCSCLQLSSLRDHCDITVLCDLTRREAWCLPELQHCVPAGAASRTNISMGPCLYLKEGEGMTAAHAGLQRRSPSAHIAAGTANGAVAPALAAPQIQPSTAGKRVRHLSDLDQLKHCQWRC